MARRGPGVSVRAARSGFTLVELLVVISIIGMLAALLLPAVNQAREAGRRTTCLNNQKQIGLGLMQYEQRNGFFPGYVNAQAIDPSTGEATRPVGWMFSVLPYLERNDLVEQYGSAAFRLPGGPEPPGSLMPSPYNAPNVSLKIALCPSDARAEPMNAGSATENLSASSYVANCGVKDDPERIGVTNTTLPRDVASNGVFHFNYPYDNLGIDELNGSEFVFGSTTGAKTGESIVKVSTSQITDGTATTLLISENIDSGNWTNIWESRVGFVWQAGATSGVAEPIACTLGENLATGLSPDFPGLLRINEKFGEYETAPQSTSDKDQDGRPLFARPSSYHPGGVNATFCDGHTQFLADTIDYIVYCHLMTPRGKASATATVGTQGPIALDTNANYRVYTRSSLDEGKF